MITVATVPNCQQDKTAQDTAIRNNWTGAPVVYATNNNGDVVHSWHGYNPHAIDFAIQAGHAN